METNSIVNLRKLNGCKLLNIETEQPKAKASAYIQHEFPVKLEFDKYTLTYDGFFYQTPTETIGKTVQYVFDQQTLGFIAMCQVNFLRLNQEDYRQCYIGMEGSNNDKKIELRIVYRNLKLIQK